MTELADSGFTAANAAPQEDGIPAVSTLFFVKYAAAIIGIYIALMTPVTVTMAIRVQAIAPEGKGAALGSILGLGALFALFANPIFGWLSDRTVSRYGRRRPWMLAGIVLGGLAVTGIAFSENLFVIGALWCLAQTTYNAALAVVVAIVPDQVPEHQRGRVSAISGMALYIAMLMGAGIAALTGASNPLGFIAPALVATVAIFWFAIGLEDPHADKAAKLQHQSMADLGRSFLINPVKHADFSWAWLSRFFVFLGMSVLMTYQAYFLIDHLGMPSAGIADLLFLSTLITAIAVIASSFISGWLSDRLHRRKVFVLASAIGYSLGIVIILSATTLGVFYVGVAVSSLAFGIYMAVDQALVVDVLPDRETDAAKNMGILNIANAVPQSIAPAIAPFFLAIGATGGNYPALYAFAAVAAFLGALAIWPVKGVR
ncbi:MFS transporter [Martelella mangrovi]|uniref:MFS family permease n=1 Tax=Martelella mangrovi TaxID=1397477 RepID=A0ABV2IDD4_9HYPH